MTPLDSNPPNTQPGWGSIYLPLLLDGPHHPSLTTVASIWPLLFPSPKLISPFSPGSIKRSSTIDFPIGTNQLGTTVLEIKPSQCCKL